MQTTLPDANIMLHPNVRNHNDCLILYGVLCCQLIIRPSDDNREILCFTAELFLQTRLYLPRGQSAHRQRYQWLGDLDPMSGTNNCHMFGSKRNWKMIVRNLLAHYPKRGLQKLPVFGSMDLRRHRNFSTNTFGMKGVIDEREKYF